MLAMLEVPESTLPPALMLVCPTKEKLNKGKVIPLLSLAKIYIFQNQYQNPVYLNHIIKFLKNITE